MTKDQVIGDDDDTPKQATLSSIRPFQLVSSLQRMQMERAIMQSSGLRRDQIAVNSWGFPPIPIPEPRYGGGKVRMAPQNVSNEWLGHPIYWVDQDLTQYSEQYESQESWSIRMFYLILGFSLWEDNENLSWIDYPWSQGFSYTAFDIHGYHLQGNPKCALDDIPILGIDDLHVSLDRVKNSYKITMDHCNQTLKGEVEDFLDKQAFELDQARRVLGDIYSQEYLSPDQEGSLWTRFIAPKLQEISNTYDHRVQNGESVSDIIKPLYDALDEFYQIHSRIDEIISTLCIPVIRSAETASDAYGQMITYLGIANQQAHYRQGQHELLSLAEQAITERKMSSISHILDRAYSIHLSTWRRLVLSVVNYDRMREGGAPFSSYSEIEMEHVNIQNQRQSRERTREFDDGQLIQGEL